MPGVRYGPDIADDAAYVMNTLVELRNKMRGLKPGRKLGGKDGREYDKMKKIANEIFGVRPSDIDKGRYGALGQLAQYSIAGRNPRGKAYNRSKAAKSWRTGRIMKRGVRQEFEKRGQRPGGREVLGTTPGKEGGASYLGRTKTRKFDELANAAYARAKRKGYIKEATAGAFDKVGVTGSGGIARQGPRLPGIGQAYGATSGKRGQSIRPPTPKSARTTSSRQSKRRRTVSTAGRTEKTRSTTRTRGR